MKIIATAVIGLVVPLASLAHAAEGVLISEKTVTGKGTRTTHVQLEPDRMRAESTTATGESQIIVFDGPQQVLRMISNDRKSYTEMTKEDLTRMGARMNGVMAEMQKKMAEMPPAQRAQMEAAMARMGRGGTQTKTEYRKAGSDKVGNWTCERYEGFKNEEKVSEVCTVEPSTLGLTPADFEISKQVAAFFQTLAPQGADQLFGIGTVESQGFSGIPVRRSAFVKGQLQSTSEVIEVKRQTFAPTSYDVPAGYQKQAIGGQGRP